MTQDQDFAAHVRYDIADDEELRQSLKTFGWHAEFPAIADQGGAVLVGNRRLKIAKEEGIQPVIKVINFGQGSEADAERIKVALISNLGSQPLSKNDRRRIAEHLYGEKGWTMARIGAALGVSKMQISYDLENCKAPLQNTRAEKRGRKKQKKRREGVEERYEKIVAYHDAGMSAADIAEAVGVVTRVVHHAIELENARREVPEPAVNVSMLSKSAQEKLAAAIKAHKKKLDREFDFRVTEGVRKWVDEMTLPQHVKEIEEARELMRSRRHGIMPKRIFNLVRSCLHTDSRKSVSDRKLDEAFHEFSSRERLLLSEDEDPTPNTMLPQTRAGWEELKRKVKEERRQKRHNRASGNGVNLAR